MPDRKFAAVAALATAALASALFAQSEARKPLAFEVASIKPSQGNTQGGGIRAMPGGQTYVAQNATLRLMIMLMYKVADSQVVGGPDWMNTALWDVNAKAEKPSNIDQLHEMYQTLLADRFHLKFHMDTKELPAFVVTVDKGGSRMKPNPSPEPFDIPIKPTGPGKLAGTHVDMKYLCWFFGQPLQSPVVDQTGLKGFYDFNLEVPPPDPDRQKAEGAGRGVDPGDALAAIREQLGLKFERRKAPVEVMVIDHAEKPGEN